MIDIQQLIDLEYVTDYFLEMTNEEILKLNDGKKFDIVLMNPPYQQRGTDNPIHFRFVEKCINIANKQISIFPNKILQTNAKNYDDWKEKLSKYLISADEVDSKYFSGTKMPPVAIYVFDNNKPKNDKIKLTSLDGTESEIDKLSNTKLYNEYEENILNILDNDNKLTIFNLTTRIPKTDNKEKIIEDKTKKIKGLKNKYDGKYLLSVNIANGAMDGTYVTKHCGKIFNNFNNVLKDWIDRNVSSIKYIVLDTQEQAENCLAAMKRPLLRLALYRTQDDRSLNNKCYRFVPNIDWEDERVKTDEGLLEVCGCPKEKCKEYADYCKEVIDKVDNK